MRQEAREDKRKRKTIVSLVTVVMGGYFVVSLVRNLVDFSGLGERVVEIEEEVQLLEEENQRLREEAFRVESEQYAEREIRDKLGLVKPGEEVVVLPQDYLREENGVAEEVVVEEKKANWRKWVELFL